jgi:hypothetical protein
VDHITGDHAVADRHQARGDAGNAGVVGDQHDGLAVVAVEALKFGEDFRYLAGHGMMGTDFDSCCHNWATQGLNYYVVARLHWNPEQDVVRPIANPLHPNQSSNPVAKKFKSDMDKLGTPAHSMILPAISLGAEQS